MLKFLRKYNKLILVIGGSFLMVAFLLPAALTRGGGGANPKVVRIADDTIRAREYQAAAARVQLYERLGILWGFVERQQSPVEHWLMLAHAAREGGFVGGPTDGAEVLNTYIPPEMRDAIVNSFGADAVYQALAEWRGVLRMISTYTGAGRLSESEALLLALEIFDEAQVRAAVIDAQQLIDEIPEPTEEEILAHFEKYKDLARGQGDFGFGYRLNAAIQLRWIALQRLTLAGAVKPDPIEVRKRWQANRTRFPGEFEVERGAVEREVRDEQVEILMREADQLIQAAAVEEEKMFPLKGRRHEVPDDWQTRVKQLEVIGFDIAKAVEARTGTLVAPSVQRRDRWLDTADLAGQSGIGQSQVAIGARLVPFPLIINEVQEIGGPEARGPQVGLLNRRFARDQIGNQYYYRITDARKEGPPRSVDEVRETVVNDLRRLHAYERLKEQTDTLRQRVLAEGMQAVADDMGGQVMTGIVTEQDMRSLPNNLNTEGFRAAVMQAARSIDPTRPIEEVPLSERLVVVPVDSGLAVAIVEIDGRRPLTREKFRDNVSLIEQVAAREAIQGMEDWPYSFDALKARYHLTQLGVRDSKKDREEALEEGNEAEEVSQEDPGS